jgi:hypothetical protein
MNLKITKSKKIEVPLHPRYVGTCTILYVTIEATIQNTRLYKFTSTAYSTPYEVVYLKEP